MTAAGGVDGADAVELSPNRGPGYFYGVIALVVVVVVLAAVGANLAGGHLVAAGVTLVVGLGLTAFLALLSVAILGPLFAFGPHGVTGRTTFRRAIDLSWADVAIDVAEESAPGQLQLAMAGEKYALSGRSWSGFRDFVILVASTPAASRSLSPAARDEVTRLLGIAGIPGPDWPEPAS